MSSTSRSSLLLHIRLFLAELSSSTASLFFKNLSSSTRFTVANTPTHTFPFSHTDRPVTSVCSRVYIKPICHRSAAMMNSFRG
ncbi:hypothetical protein NC651_016624 [Populus alba x Populus x berolinensis]|nr:hypothetical protein NC651_016624 [Populus alba x Populus x berolinensis]